MGGERQLIAAIRDLLGPPPEPVLCGLGDDTAIILPDQGYVLLWTIDSLVEGVHFDLAYTPLKVLGRKALAVNLSDIAAMGGEPQYALLALGWPPDRELSAALDLVRGMQEIAREYRTALVGGDTVSSPGCLSLSLTVWGRVKPDEVLRRDRARVGDLIYVTGPLGRAAAGLEMLRRGLSLPAPVQETLRQAFLDPRPQVAAGRLLAAHHLATAAIDLSDGVASDLEQICLLSHVGAFLEAAWIPLTPEVLDLADLAGKDPLKMALQGGEDYQLLFTAPPEKAGEIQTRFGQAHLPAPTCIGRIVAGGGVKLRRGVTAWDIAGAGFDHFPKPENVAPIKSEE